MEIVLSFITKYWYVIVWLVLEVVFGVLLLLKKSRSNEPLNNVISILTRLVIFAENRFSSGHGSDKKLWVMKQALEQYKYLTGVSVSEESEVYRILSQKVEEILKTPQKKEDK